MHLSRWISAVLTAIFLVICSLATGPRAEPEASITPSGEPAALDAAQSDEPAARPFAGAADRIAALWEAGIESKRIRFGGADGDPALALSGLEQTARAIGGLGSTYEASYDAWKLAHRLKYSMQVAKLRASTCKPNQQDAFCGPVEPELEAQVLAEIDALIAQIGVERPGVDYLDLPPKSFDAEGILNDLIDVFEGSHPTIDDYRPIVELDAELRPFVYAPALTPIRFYSDYLPALRALQEQLSKDQKLAPRKRDELSLKVEFAIQYFELRARWSLC